MEASTLRPGLLVSVKTSISGNVTYRTKDIDPDHIAADGSRQARWETERVITDPAEHEAAVKARSKARNAVQGACAQSAFGLLCPEANADKLDAAICEARKIIEEFNAGAKLSRLGFYVIAGRIAPDDVEAVRAINSEVRELLADMAAGVGNLDVKVIREAANRARSVGTMLAPDAQRRVQAAIDLARSAARKIAKAGEQAAVEVDRLTVAKITEARTAFLDLDDVREVEAPDATGRAIDFEPAPVACAAPAAVPAFEL